MTAILLETLKLGSTIVGTSLRTAVEAPVIYLAEVRPN